MTDYIDFLIKNPDKSKYICKHIKERSYQELELEWQLMYDKVIEYLKQLKSP